MKQLVWTLLAAALFLWTGCSKSDSATELDVGSESLVWDSDVREYTVKLTANGKWVAESNVYWCDPLKHSGEGSADLHVWVSPNLTSTAREGQITIRSAKATRTIKVSQPAFKGSLDNYVYHLPVVFHVLYKDKTDENQYVKEGHLAKIIDGVNQLYADNQMNIRFEMAQYDNSGDELDEPGVERHEVSFDEYDPSLFLSSRHDDNHQYAEYAYNLKKFINIFVFTFKSDDESSQTLGISTMPIMPTAHQLDSLYTTDAANDYAYVQSPWGCCINNKFIYEWQDDNTYNTRYVVTTLAHELGHYLGLLHAFSDDECNNDDACSDTHICDYDNYVNYINAYINQQVAQGVKTLKMSVVSTRTDCLTLEEYQAHNIMDYAYCFCDELTAQQRARTRYVLQYAPLVPGPKLVLYNTTGVISKGANGEFTIDAPVRPCPAVPKGGGVLLH